MAKNREPEKSIKSESDSGEDETDDSSEEIESEPETGLYELTQVPNKPSTALKKAQPAQPSHPPEPSSDDDSGSESESESESDDNVGPTKPIADSQNPSSRKPPTKSAASEPVTPAKRPAEEKETEASKKLKKKAEPLTESKDEKKPKKSSEASPEKIPTSSTGSAAGKVLFQRLWSEDDEIVILKGMLEYAAKMKSNPIADLDAFLDFIKKSLHVEVTKVQLQDKIRRLRKKYENNKSKDRTLSKPHEKEAYNLSEKIWGNEKGKEMVTTNNKVNGSVASKTPIKKSSNVVENGEEAVTIAEFGNGDVDKVVVARAMTMFGGSPEERVFRIGAELFGAAKDVEGSKEWRKLQIQEMEALMALSKAKWEQMKLVVDRLKRDDN